MEARRESTANLRADKKKIQAEHKKVISRLPKDQRKSKRLALKKALQAVWKKFTEKYPHWKKVKTIEALRRLTDTVKHHRLR